MWKRRVSHRWSLKGLAAIAVVLAAGSGTFAFYTCTQTPNALCATGTCPPCEPYCKFNYQHEFCKCDTYGGRGLRYPYELGPDATLDCLRFQIADRIAEKLGS